MKTSTKIAVAFVALAGISGAALSAQADSRWSGRGDGPESRMQQAGSGGMRHHGGGHEDGRHMFRMLESFDVNGDGKLSQAEIDETRAERFTSFDADSDQTLTLAEYEQLWLAAMREKMVDRFQDLDADGDAKITAEEFKAPFANLVRHMDRNDDGVVNREDSPRRQHRGPMADDNG
ncbi:MAG TPA: hypothetical protein VGA60_11785 [Kiloniellales bacterium]|jgi:hypothetical protein